MGGDPHVLVCAGGVSCDVSARGWDCCTPRVQCPSSRPRMCASTDCAGEHCCELDCAAHGGDRPCPVAEEEPTAPLWSVLLLLLLLVLALLLLARSFTQARRQRSLLDALRQPDARGNDCVV